MGIVFENADGGFGCVKARSATLKNFVTGSERSLEPR